MADEGERTLEEQVNDLLEETPVVEEVQEDEPEVEEPIEEEVNGESTGEVVAEEESKEEVPDVGEVEAEEPNKPEEVEEVKGDDGQGEVEEVDEIADFRDRMNKIAEAALRQGVQLPADLLGIEESEEAPVAPAVAPVAAPATTPAAVSYDDFKILMDGVEFDNFMDNEETFTKGMRNILFQHEQMLAQRFMAAIPNIVQNQVQQSAGLQRAVDGFYAKNEDLLEVRPTVGAVASQISAKHPDWDINRVMVESAKTTRKLLRMPSPSVVRGGKKVVRPSFAKQGGSQQRNKPKPEMSKLQRELDDLMEG